MSYLEKIRNIIVQNSGKLLIVLFSFSVYSTLFFLLIDAGEKVSVLALFPIIVSSLIFGLKIGVAIAVLLIPVNWLYFHLGGFNALDIMILNTPGVLGSIVIAVAAGYMSDLAKRSRIQLEQLTREINERKKAEARITELQRELETNVLSKGALSENKNGATAGELFPTNISFADKNYKEIADNAVDIIYTVDANGRFTFANKAALDNCGYTINELKNLTYLDLVADEYRSRVKNFYFRQYVSRKKSTYFEIPFTQRSGMLKWFGQNAALILDNSEVVGFSIIARDITQRKQMELSLRESETMLRLVTETANDAIITCDNNFNIIQWNNAAEGMYGYSKEEIIGKPLVQLMSVEEKKIFLKNVIESEGQPFKFDHGKQFKRMGRKKDGTVFHIEVSIADWERKGRVYYTHIIRDITDRVNREKELEEYREHLEQLVEERTEKFNAVNRKLSDEIDKLTIAESQIRNQIEFLEILINTIPIPVYIRNRDKIFIDCNKSFEEFFGLKKEKVTGKSNNDLFPPELAEIYNKMDEEILDKKGRVGFETKVNDREGILHEVVIYQTVFKNNKDEIEGTVGVILDITDQKNLQREIKKSLDKEKELGELRSAFISTVSHEFRTPLTTILSSSDLIELYNSKEGTESTNEFVHKIQKAVAYMIDLIDDVLIINKAEAGKLKFNPRFVDINNLIKEIVEDAKALSNNKHTFLVNIKVNSQRYNIDPKLFKQILSNLLSNAVKYSPNGGRIQLEVNEANSMLKTSVSDNGIGISEEDQKHLFEAFYRCRNAENIPGTGLGLSITKKAVELHNGTITVQSASSKGTTFTFQLPVDKASEIV